MKEVAKAIESPKTFMLANTLFCFKNRIAVLM
jgi:hypothetical protein